MKKLCCLQDWVLNLSIMQQSVLIAAVRGPDGLKKDHDVKVLCRWLRRSFLISAFDKRAILDPVTPGGGSFTGPSIHCNQQFNICEDHSNLDYCTEFCPSVWQAAMDKHAENYLRYVDELPHHFQLHFMHAAEILGYKHPNLQIKKWWNKTYLKIVNDAHLYPESEAVMDKRLGDCEADWRSAEEVIAK